MKQENNQRKPPLPLLFSRMTDWSGWEYLYEERRKVAACFILGICFLLGIGWLVSKKQTSSLSKLIQAETLVTTIVDPDGKESEKTIQENSEKLFSLSKDPNVFSRFCGVLAQEDILTRGQNLDASFFDATSDQLIDQGFPTLSSLVQATLVQETGSKEEALQKIETLRSETALPWFTLYLLLQKAQLLKELGNPNDQVIEEIKTIAAAIESVDDFFEERFHLTSSDFFETLAVTK